ncbi:hypothetical protein THERMOT_613 [Bathymodiolus thermophilus thioautotrophic gill symbiont]|uniref:cadherin domain-containing protein n=1 Tax=Bathymodiolus thermophilus thioautotrophic gill symbiont TaxID=2360 RepID=UPI00192C0AE3|nr:cadherin domain-containing protein [Bathymodiolus thermophilus thioautotrophic gill symbiont]CAB5496990.1 hypothetical protein THERMOT_613 [Bathymodiolus thermophilus thioautotrophic gill symbiont]
MNMFNRFIITTLLVLFTSQVFATKPLLTNAKRIDHKTILITFDQPVKMPEYPVNKGLSVNLYSERDPQNPASTLTYYLGSAMANADFFSPESLNPVDGFAQQMKITLNQDSFNLADNSGKHSVTLYLNNVSPRNKDGEQGEQSYHNNLVLAGDSSLNILSFNTFNANEGDISTYTLIPSDTAATFSITENSTGNLFSLSGTNNTTLTFNGTGTDFKNGSKSYTVKVKATIGKAAHQNTEQTITVNINDINEAPTDITLSNTTVIENTTTIGTLTNTDDALGTETYSLISGFGDNASFSITGATLSLNTAADYESKTSYSIKVRATDGALTFDKAFTITITDANDTNPSNIILSTTVINDGAESGTTIATLSATDADTVGTLTYALSGDDASSFSINGNQLKIAENVVYSTKSSYNINITANDGVNTSDATTFTLTVNPNPINITNVNIVRDEGSALTALTITATNEPSGQTLTYEISGADAELFNLNGNIVTFKVAPDYEVPNDNGSDNIYNLELKVNDTISTTSKAITITIHNLKENTITIANQTRSINENSAVGTDIGTPLATVGTVTSFAITTGNNDGFFTINSTGQIQVAKLGLDHETKQNYILTVEIKGTDAKDETAEITISLNNLNDTAPTNITLSKKNIVLGEPAGTVIGALFATDTDDDDLTYTVNDINNFEISGNKLKIKQVTTEIHTYPIIVTANDGVHTSEPQSFDITITATHIAAPVIAQFTVTQDENKGPLISKDGGEVTISASAGTGTYAWSSDDFSGTNTNKTFVFNPQSVNVGTRTITLKVTTGDFSSERVLKLKLVDTYPNGRTDTNSNGISDSKESGNSNNELPASTNKKITSPNNTRILPGIMGEDSGQLTLDQLKQYRAANHLSDYTKDTLATGDIYDYIIEGLSASGASTQVTIELTTPIPENAVLRQYSLVTGWRNFVVDNNNIQSKTNTSNTCTDTDGIWQTGLITGATCLKLTLKDGGENDADGNHANGVVENTVSIATPVVGGSGNIDDNSNSSSGGGCVYNPNTSARFDMVFILLMTLSAYYLIRRRRRFSH